MLSGNLKTKANYILGTNSYEGNQFWQFQDIWEFDDLKYENITNVFRITNGYEGQGSSDSTGSRNRLAVHESLTKKDNRQLPEDTSIFRKKCNRKLLTSILISIKVTHAINICHQFPSPTSVTNYLRSSQCRESWSSRQARSKTYCWFYLWLGWNPRSQLFHIRNF